MTVNLAGVGLATILPIPINSPKTIYSLPQELQDKIFSFLTQEDLEAAVLVNRRSNISVNVASNFNEPAEIKNFISVLIQQLNAGIFPDQKEMLSKILHDITPQKCVILRLLKEYIFGVKKRLINVIKTLDTETANHLRDHAHLPVPHFFENIFELAAFERQIDQAHLIPNVRERGYRLCDISRALADAGSINRALAVATSIPDENTKWSAFSGIVSALTQAGDIDRALALANSILYEFQRCFALRSISRVLTDAGNIDRALAVATSIPKEDIRKYPLYDIFDVLKQAGDIDRALAVATLIPDEKMREDAFQDIKALTF